MKKKKLIAGIISLAVICVMPVAAEMINKQEETAVAVKIPEEERLTIVIDPGHGGIDGGAVSSSGIEEKKINLEIGLQLRDIIKGAGHNVIMTREKDEGLYDLSKSTVREKKNQDMKARKNIIDEANADLTISIHLNSFIQDKSVHGAQCFYPKETSKEVAEKSKKLAESIQETLEKNLPDEKERVPQSKTGLYIFTNCKSPVVIVECGFLSNNDDEKMLKIPKNQQIIAKSIWEGIEKSGRTKLQ